MSKISFKHMPWLYQQKPRRNWGKAEARCPVDAAASSSATAFQGRMYLQHWIHSIEFEAISFCQPVWVVLVRRWGRTCSECQIFRALGSGKRIFYTTETNTISSESKICAEWSLTVKSEFFLLSQWSPYQIHMFFQGLFSQG